MKTITSSSYLEGSSLAKYVCLLEKGNSLELVLDANCSDDTVDELVKELRNFQACIGARDNVRIASLFVHKSFLKNISEAQKIDIFGCLSDLEQLSLSSATITAEALITLLAQATHLKKIRLDRITIQCCELDESNTTDRLCEVLEELPFLEEFHMSFRSNGLDRNDEQGVATLFVGGEADNLEPLVQALSAIKPLRSVYLSSDRRIHLTVMEPTTLASLSTSVEGITLRNIGLGPLHYACFYSKNLRSLNLIQTGLGDEGALVLAQTIRRASNLASLKKLYLAGNGITDRGGVAIVQALQDSSRNLEVLDLHANNMALATALALSEWIGTRKCGLTFLDLSGNVRVGDEGGVALASALLGNTSLQQLVLFHCGLGNATCAAVASSLSVQRSLTKLNLHDNDLIGEEGVMALIECLGHYDSALKFLELSTTPRTKELSKTLQFFLQLNRDFKRGTLLQTASDQKFVDACLMKAASQEDPSASFYFLSARPTLFSSPPPPSTPTLSKPEKVATSSAFSRIRPIRHRQTRILKPFCSPQA